MQRLKQTPMVSMTGSQAAPARRVLTRNQASEVADHMLHLAKERTMVTGLDHTFQSIVKVSRNRVAGAYSVDTGWINFYTAIGSGIGTAASVNVLDPQLLAEAAGEILAEATPPQTETPHSLLPDEYRGEYVARNYLPVDLWHEDTVRASGAQAMRVADAMVQAAKRAGLVAAGTITLTQKAQVVKSPLGLFAFGEETDAEVTMTARSPDGTASGWFGDVNRNWSHIDTGAIIANAVQLSEQSKGAVGLEPGRRVAILSPFAVAQLLYPLMGLFDSFSTNRGGTPFSHAERRNRVGLRVFDERIQMMIDPQDSDGGFPPFVQRGMLSPYPAGIPVSQTTIVENGVLKSLMYDVRDAAREGHRPMGGFEPVRMQATPGTVTTTLDEMIASCEDGVYVNRFSDVSMVDGTTGLMTGVTRDGCFHVRKGKIHRPIRNFRFTDSPMFAFNSILHIGTAQRVPLGFMQVGNNARGEIPRTPLFPMVCPPLMVQDFNFSGLSDAV